MLTRHATFAYETRRNNRVDGNRLLGVVKWSLGNSVVSVIVVRKRGVCTVVIEKKMAAGKKPKKPLAKRRTAVTNVVARTTVPRNGAKHRRPAKSVKVSDGHERKHFVFPNVFRLRVNLCSMRKPYFAIIGSASRAIESKHEVVLKINGCPCHNVLGRTPFSPLKKYKISCRYDRNSR